MPHQHGHNCGHESHDHDHDHSSEELGFQDNLFKYIDLPNAVALNADGLAANVIKPWNERLDETKFLESDADDQMILRIPFTGAVRLKALLLKAGPEGHTPTKISLFANQPSLDFDDVNDQTPTQEFVVPQGREVGEYTVKTAKFTNLSSVTLFIPSAQGEDSSRIYYVGFLGQWSEQKNNPIITVYEAQANAADHEKIQGMDGAFNTPGQ